ncbi:MAG: hypothetical protein ABSE57_03405 [Bryobacteraceae bacterium]|jgi:hypothetical protein
MAATTMKLSAILLVTATLPLASVRSWCCSGRAIHRGRLIPTGAACPPIRSLPGWDIQLVSGKADTLAVEANGFTEASWLDGSGHPRSEQMRIRELYHRRDIGHMDLEVTFEDPKYYTRPFTIKTGLDLIPDSDILEFVCAENEKDRAHMGKP